MGSDDLHKKRKKSAQKLRRNAPTRQTRKRILIVCEDTESSTTYLKKLVHYFKLATADIKVVGVGQDPSNILKKGKDEIDKNEDYDIAYFVFDRDSHAHYKNIVKNINGSKYKRVSLTSITSYPCFEFWLLMHVSNSTTQYDDGISPCQKLTKELKKYQIFKTYDKGNFFDKQQNFDAVIQHMDTAKQNAKIVLNNVDGDRHFQNPHTLIHEVVEQLEKMAKNQ